jgi:hypothetical protein
VQSRFYPQPERGWAAASSCLFLFLARSLAEIESCLCVLIRVLQPPPVKSSFFWHFYYQYDDGTLRCSSFDPVPSLNGTLEHKASSLAIRFAHNLLQWHHPQQLI